MCWPTCCLKSRKAANKGNKALRKECFTNICPDTSFFYWLIMLWILLIVLSIAVYGVLLVEVLTLDDSETTEMIMNIVMHIVNGLFTFAAVLNLPVRCNRLWKLFKNRKIIKSRRKITLNLFPSGGGSIKDMSTLKWEEESRLIFDRLAWSTQHAILQALLWNSLFQIINQVFRCIYYSYELSETYPGKIYVNSFFPLAILASVIAALTQAIAENGFRKKWSLGKKENNCWKTTKEFWNNLWKVQTEGKMALAQQFTSQQTQLVIHTPFFDLRERTVDNSEHRFSLGEQETVDMYERPPIAQAVIQMSPSIENEEKTVVVDNTPTAEKDDVDANVLKTSASESTKLC